MELPGLELINLVIIFAPLLMAQTAWAEDATQINDMPSVREEKRLQLKQIITEIPTTSKRAFSSAFSSEAILPWTAILGSTAILVEDDERWLAESKRMGRKLDWAENDKTETKVELFGKDIFRFPTDKGSSVYFLGDGWLHMSIAAGFMATGHIGNETKPFNVGVQMVHSMMTSTIYNQALKRSFGRETPNFATKRRGAMRPFPGFKNYGEESAKYDAMPSGHIMTVTSQFTIFHLNYPQYAPWTFTVGAIWGTALMLQMVNNGVHWWSDYPLGIGMGYLFGRQAFDMGKSDSDIENKKKTKCSEVTFFPYISREGSILNWAWQF